MNSRAFAALQESEAITAKALFCSVVKGYRMRGAPSVAAAVWRENHRQAGGLHRPEYSPP